MKTSQQQLLLYLTLITTMLVLVPVPIPWSQITSLKNLDHMQLMMGFIQEVRTQLTIITILVVLTDNSLSVQCNSRYFNLNDKWSNTKRLTRPVLGANTCSAGTGSPAVADDKCIGFYLRKFTVMNDYALSKAVFLISQPVGVKFDDLNHWNSPEDSLWGPTTKLYEELPLDLHGRLVSQSSFHTTVRALHSITFKLLTVFICSILRNIMCFVAHWFTNSKPKLQKKCSIATNYMILINALHYSFWTPVPQEEAQKFYLWSVAFVRS